LKELKATAVKQISNSGKRGIAGNEHNRKSVKKREAMQRYSEDEAYRAFMAAVIARAIDDLKGTGPRSSRKETDQAMAFILSETCEAYCLELEIDHEAVKEKAAALYRRFLGSESSGPYGSDYYKQLEKPA